MESDGKRRRSELNKVAAHWYFNEPLAALALIEQEHEIPFIRDLEDVLTTAIQLKFEKAARRLLELVVPSVIMQLDVHGNPSPFRAAVESTDGRFLEMMIEKGCLPLGKRYDHWGGTPVPIIVICAEHATRSTMRVLIDNALADDPASIGQAYVRACKYDNAGAVEAFLDIGMSPTTSPQEGHTMVCYVLRHSMITRGYAVIETLLRRGGSAEGCQSHHLWKELLRGNRLQPLAMWLRKMTVISHVDFYVCGYHELHRHDGAQLWSVLTNNISLCDTSNRPADTPSISYSNDHWAKFRERFMRLLDRNTRIHDGIKEVCVLLLAARRAGVFAPGLDVRLLQGILRDRVWSTRFDPDVWLH